jgi:hypothetical protein
MHAQQPPEPGCLSPMRTVRRHLAQLPAEQSIGMQRWDLLIQENATLARQLGEVQRRVTRQLAQQARVIQTLQAQCMQLRAAVITRDTALSVLRQHMTVNQVTGPAFNPR